MITSTKITAKPDSYPSTFVCFPFLSDTQMMSSSSKLTGKGHLPLCTHLTAQTISLRAGLRATEPSGRAGTHLPEVDPKSESAWCVGEPLLLGSRTHPTVSTACSLSGIDMKVRSVQRELLESSLNPPLHTQTLRFLFHRCTCCTKSVLNAM